MANILRTLKNKYVAMRGFHTNRHLVVIESDDWGSIRMPSREVFCHLQECGDHPERDGFLRNDSLETEGDLTALYEVLSSVRDQHGSPAVITANYVMANPDFDRIDIEAGRYSHEPFWKTYEKYGMSADRMLQCIQQGIQEGVFYPQLHCREHLNVNRWMQALREGRVDARLAFENRMIGVYASFSPTNRFGYMDAFNTDVTSMAELEEILGEAAAMFAKTFGYESKTFVASCFVWDNALERAMPKHGILGIQSAVWQDRPVGKNGQYKLKRKIRYTGQKSKHGPIYTVRNCAYEPAILQNPDECVKACLDAVHRSFAAHKPAIINSHRLNYIGTIHPHNAQDNLRGLKQLLTQIKQDYADVEFITSAQLIDIIRQEEK